jgi:uncharacterized protein (UPF0332 family)
VTEVPLGSASEELALARETLEAARVLLASIGRRARTHDGVRALVNEHFVRPGSLAAEHARTLRQTAGDRADADYDASATFEPTDSDSGIARAESFLAAVEAVLAGSG